MAKVPKIVKEELEKIPDIMIGFAQSAVTLSQECTRLALNLRKHIEELEIEDD